MAPMGRPLLEARHGRSLSETSCSVAGRRKCYPGDHDVAGRRCSLTDSAITGAKVADRERDRDHGRQRQSPGLRRSRRARAIVGRNVMLGYYKDPEIDRRGAQSSAGTTPAILALIDENGEVLFLDRKKDMIKSGGEKCRLHQDRGDAAGASRRAETRPSSGCRIRNGVRRLSAFVKLKPGAAGIRSGDIRALPQVARRLPRSRRWSGSSTTCR